MEGIDGRQAERMALGSYSEVFKTRWYQKSPSYTSDDIRLSLAAGEMPEEDQRTALADLERTIINYVDQMTARFITGDMDLDTEMG